MLAATCLKEGPGLPIVFLHGFLGKGSDWEAVCSYLPPCRCIAYDLPGHGNSPFMEEITIPEDQFHLVGYSMGGRLALAFAAQHAKRVATLTLCSTHPGLTTEDARNKKWEKDCKWAKLLFQLPIDEFLSQWYDQPIFKPYVPDLTLRKQQNIESLAASLLHFSTARQPLYPIGDALILVGEKDTAFRNLYSNPILISNAGHMVHLENPKQVALEIAKRVFG